jgi:hypothetical protein
MAKKIDKNHLDKFKMSMEGVTILSPQKKKTSIKKTNKKK